jgi:hypothetical protein
VSETITYTAECPEGGHDAVWRGSQTAREPDVYCETCEPSLDRHRPYVPGLAVLRRLGNS